MAAENVRRVAEGFGQHDYEISYRRSEAGGEVRISGRIAQPLLVGDVYTLERVGEVHDVVVTEVRNGPGGAWSARCEAVVGA